MRARTLISAALLVLSACIAPSATAFECGKPGALCGNSIPEGVQCDKGAGWCEPGYYCGRPKGTINTTCMPVPKDCGKAGNKCCPSNADRPQRANRTGIDPVTGEQEDRRPFCRDGSTCYFDSQLYYTVQAPAGLVGCVAVPKDCGLKEGSPCCPNTYHIALNPYTASTGRPSCPINHFCGYDEVNGPKFPGSSLLLMPTGTCIENKPDCGRVGKPCCINNGGYSSSYRCSPESGVKGYCADKAGNTWGNIQDMICNTCPAKVDDALKASNPGVYRECKPRA